MDIFFLLCSTEYFPLLGTLPNKRMKEKRREEEEKSVRAEEKESAIIISFRGHFGHGKCILWGISSKFITSGSVPAKVL